MATKNTKKAEETKYEHEVVAPRSEDGLLDKLNYNPKKQEKE